MQARCMPLLPVVTSSNGMRRISLGLMRGALRHYRASLHPMMRTAPGFPRTGSHRVAFRCVVLPGLHCKPLSYAPHVCEFVPVVRDIAADIGTRLLASTTA